MTAVPGQIRVRWPAALLAAALLHAALLLSDSGAPDAALRQDSRGQAQGAGGPRARPLLLRLAPVTSPETAMAQAAGELPPVAGASPAAEDAGGGGRDGYYARLRVHLQHYRRPLLRGADTVQGTAVVQFRVGADGALSGLALASSAGDARLDAEALALLRRAQPLPRPPGGHALHLRVPVVFD